MMLYKKLGRVAAILLLLLLQSSCLEFLFGSSTPAITEDNTIEITTPKSATENSFTPDTETSLPISYFDTSQMFLATPDANSQIGVVILPGGVDLSSQASVQDADGDGFVDDYVLTVSTLADGIISSTAHAKEFFLPFKTALANQATTQHCPIAIDFSVECFFDPKTLSPAQLHLALTTKNGDIISAVVAEPVQAHLYYLRQAQTDMIYAQEQLYVVAAEKTGVQIASQSAGAPLKLAGVYQDNYKTFSADGQNLIFDAAYNLFSVMDQTGGFNLLTESAESILEQLAYITNSLATQYTVCKSFRNTLYYGIAQNSDDEAYLYHLYEDSGHGADLIDTTYDHLKFIARGDVDVLEAPLTHARTLSFAFNDADVAAVLYQDAANQFRIRAAHSTTRFGGEMPLHASEFSTLDLRDLQFYAENRALLLDALNNRLWLIVVDAAQHFVTANLNAAIEVGEGPLRFVLNAEQSKAYVLNATAQTISIISLTSSDGAKRYLPQTSGVYALNDAIPGKHFNWQPNTLTLSDEFLFVGSQNTKSILAIPLSTITETILPDEDFDRDGFTHALGDCQDNDRRIHPDRQELCGDNVDNDCNSIVDDACDNDADGYSIHQGDCNDFDANFSPGIIETCGDRTDNNCDGHIDENCDDGVSYF